MDNVLGPPDCATIEAYDIYEFQDKYDKSRPLALGNIAAIRDTDQGFRALFLLSQPVPLGNLGEIHWLEIAESERSDRLKGFSAVSFYTASLQAARDQLDLRKIAPPPRNRQDREEIETALILDPNGKEAIIRQGGVKNFELQPPGNGDFRYVHL